MDGQDTGLPWIMLAVCVTGGCRSVGQIAYQLADLSQGLLEGQGVALARLVALPDQAGLIASALLYVPAACPKLSCRGDCTHSIGMPAGANGTQDMP